MEKTAKYLILTAATIAGGWVPTLFGAESLSMWSIAGSFVGGIVGIYLMLKLDN